MRFKAVPIPVEFGMLSYAAKDGERSYVVVFDLNRPDRGWLASWHKIGDLPDVINKLGNFDTRQDAIVALEKVHSNATR